MAVTRFVDRCSVPPGTGNRPWGRPNGKIDSNSTITDAWVGDGPGVEPDYDGIESAVPGVLAGAA